MTEINTSEEEMLAYLRAGNELEPKYEKSYISMVDVVCSRTLRLMGVKLFENKKPNPNPEKKVISHSLTHICVRDFMRDMEEDRLLGLETETRVPITSDEILRQQYSCTRDLLLIGYDFQI